MDWVEQFMKQIDHASYEKDLVSELFMKVSDGKYVLDHLGSYALVDGFQISNSPKYFRNHRKFNPRSNVEVDLDEAHIYLISQCGAYARNRLLGRVRAKIYNYGEVSIYAIDQTKDSNLLDNDEIVLRSLNWKEALVTAIEEISYDTCAERVSMSRNLIDIAKKLNYTYDSSSNLWTKESNYS